MTKTEQKKAEIREKSILRIMNTCSHFNGIQHDCCKAGVSYHEQFGNGDGCFANIACIPNPEKSGRFPLKDCARKSYPDRLQATQNQDVREAFMARGLKAMNAAHADAKEKGLGKGRGGVSSCPCPACEKGTIRYSVAGYNGHIHAACTTPDCVSWME